MRPEYSLRLEINGRALSRIVIDQHYRAKRSDLTDREILDMISSLDGQHFPIDAVRGGYEFFRVEPVYRFGKPYRLILMFSSGEDFLGVVNAFRVDRGR